MYKYCKALVNESRNETIKRAAKKYINIYECAIKIIEYGYDKAIISKDPKNISYYMDFYKSEKNRLTKACNIVHGLIANDIKSKYIKEEKFRPGDYARTYIASYYKDGQKIEYIRQQTRSCPPIYWLKTHTDPPTSYKRIK